MRPASTSALIRWTRHFTFYRLMTCESDMPMLTKFLPVRMIITILALTRSMQHCRIAMWKLRNCVIVHVRRPGVEPGLPKREFYRLPVTPVTATVGGVGRIRTGMISLCRGAAQPFTHDATRGRCRIRTCGGFPLRLSKPSP